MRRFRFHLGTLVILILLMGVGFAALRESNETWDSSIFSITLVALLTSILLCVHRSGPRRAFWLGFALFGWIYVALSLVPSIETRLITTKWLAFLDTMVTRPVPFLSGYFEYGENSMDLVVVDKSQTNSLVRTKRNGDWIADVTATAGSNPTRFTNILGGRSLTGFGTTENFIRIGHSLFAIVTALLGGGLSRYLHTKKPHGSTAPAPTPVSISDASGVIPTEA
jgi:hypothetical protein